MITLKAVAAEAGVSIRTVTRMLKNEPGGNAETYKRVSAVARRLGYVPNIAARNLKIQRSNMVGLVVAARGNPMRTRIRTELQQRLESAGKHFISGTVSDQEPLLIDMLREWSGLVHDVVFVAWPHACRPARVLAGLPVRGVFVDCLDDPAYDVVEIDRTAGIREGVERLIKTGRRRIARCGPNIMNRRAGFNAAFEGRPGARPEKHEVATPGIDYQDGYDAGPAIVKRGIDAVFFETDALAFGFYKYAYEQGLRVPEDVAVVGFNDTPAAGYACPPLSSVALPIEAMAEQVLAMIMTPGSTPRHITLPTRFVRRESA